MSYCRFSDSSDVYVYASVNGGLECCTCALHDEGCPNFQTAQAMIAHLEEHQRSGHQVPDHAFDRLRSDIENGVTYEASLD